MRKEPTVSDAEWMPEPDMTDPRLDGVVFEQKANGEDSASNYKSM